MDSKEKQISNDKTITEKNEKQKRGKMRKKKFKERKLIYLSSSLEEEEKANTEWGGEM